MDLKNIEYSFNKNVIYKDRGEMLMAYNQESSDMYEFNQVGGEIFKLLSTGTPISKVFEILTNEYDVEESDIYEDVQQIIDRLIELNVIKIGGKEDAK
ncbi:MAG: PqqD family protein [bacterium]|nr:PqqD family protein [bacterium]